jgi:methylase of polypeptide subunit release factors
MPTGLSTATVPAESTSALAELGRLLAAHDYHFTCITPASHSLVNARAGNELARELEGVFGWNRPFDPQLLSPEILEAALKADVLEIGSRFARSRVRFATVGEALVVHSGFPTTSRDSVFFGPDSYRFVNLVTRALRGGGSVIELGCGTGAAALSVAHRYARVVLTDINPLSVFYAHVNSRINARLVGTADLEILQGDLFADVPEAFDAIIANPPFMIDAQRRLYRDGGPRGFELALRILRESLPRLAPRGRLVIYTGIPYSSGHSPFHREMLQILGSRRFTCEELDVDVFGDELASGAYAQIDRVAIVALTVDGVDA